MEVKPDHVLLKLDLKNGFNTMSRAAVLETYLREPKWRKFYRFFWITLSPASHIEDIPALSWEGMQQDDAAGSRVRHVLHRYARRRRVGPRSPTDTRRYDRLRHGRRLSH